MAKAGPTPHLVAGVLVAAPHNLSLGSEGIQRDFPCTILNERQNKTKQNKKNVCMYVFMCMYVCILLLHYFKSK